MICFKLGLNALSVDVSLIKVRFSQVCFPNKDLKSIPVIELNCHLLGFSFYRLIRLDPKYVRTEIMEDLSRLVS